MSRICGRIFCGSDCKTENTLYIWFSDKCHFWMNGYVNKQSMHLWCDTPPPEIEDTQLHPEKVAVWAAISSHGIIGHVFIRRTIISSSYHSLLKDDVISESDIRGHLNSAVYQQDGAKPHTSDKNLLLLRNTFKNLVISNRFPQLFNTGWNWPPYSPDLNPCNYFLWGYLKDRVYVHNFTMPEVLEAEIVRVMQDTPEEIYTLVVQNFVSRLQRVMEIDGGHVENRK